MIVRTPQAEIDAYFDDELHLSQGKLKKLLKGVDVFNKEYTEKELYYEEKEHINIGNAVDVILTQGREEFDRQFAVIMVEKPGAKLMSVVQFIFDRFIESVDSDEDVIRHSTLSLNVPPALILDGASAENFQPKWKNETIITNIIRDAGDYFDALCMNHGKQLLSPEEIITINAIVESLTTNSLTAAFFSEELPEGIDIYFQYPIYFDIDGVMCKILIDMLIVDHNNKWFSPYDLKTMGDYTVNFPRAVMRHRYDIQAAFYTAGVIKEMSNNSSLPFQQNLEDRQSFNGYSNAPFRFIVESSKEQGNPLVYECDSEVIAMGTFGRPSGFSMIHTENEADSRHLWHSQVHGYQDAIELYLWHQENGFEKDRIVVEKEGILTLGWNRKY